MSLRLTIRSPRWSHHLQRPSQIQDRQGRLRGTELGRSVCREAGVWVGGRRLGETASQQVFSMIKISLTYRADAEAEGLVLGRVLAAARFSTCTVRVGV